jgi:uncharacterized protein DUF1648
VLRRFSVFDVLAVTTLALVIAKTAVIYDELPPLMPSHFGIDGNADAWMPRARCAWFVPGVATILWATTRVAGAVAVRLAPTRARVPSPAGMPFVALASLCAVHVLMLNAALNPPHRLGNGIWVVLASALLGTLALIVHAVMSHR